MHYFHWLLQPAGGHQYINKNNIFCIIQLNKIYENRDSLDYVSFLDLSQYGLFGLVANIMAVFLYSTRSVTFYYLSVILKKPKIAVIYHGQGSKVGSSGWLRFNFEVKILHLQIVCIWQERWGFFEGFTGISFDRLIV